MGQNLRDVLWVVLTIIWLLHPPHLIKGQPAETSTSTSSESTTSGNSNASCAEPALLPEGVPMNDEPEYDLISPRLIEATDFNKTTHSEHPTCSRDAIIRYTFGRRVLPPESHSVPIEWSEHLSLRKAVKPNVVVNQYMKGDIPIWPEIIIPFLYPLLAIALALASVIPCVIIGALCWGLVFNFRFIGHKKIRMLIRSFLIKMEKLRRNRYERSFPLQHLRKFRERDRYQMPKAFQDSDLSSDDEPEELAREEIPRERTTMWSDAQIEMYGFDPDNIPMDLVYGDLLGDPSKLAPEVKDYVNKRKHRKSKQVDDYDDASLNSDEWADFLRNKITVKMQHEKELFLKSLQSKVHGMAARKSS